MAWNNKSRSNDARSWYRNCKSLILALLLGCATPLPIEALTLCVAGDSLAYPGPSGSWGNRLPSEYVVDFRGTPGATTDNWVGPGHGQPEGFAWPRVQQCFNQGATHISFNLGSNDRSPAWQITPFNQFLKMLTITQDALTIGYHQVFLFQIDPYGDFTQIICDEVEGATCIDQRGLLPNTTEYYVDINPDGLGVHPNLLGQTILADEVVRLTITPESSTIVMLGFGMGMMALIGRKRG